MQFCSFYYELSTLIQYEKINNITVVYVYKNAGNIVLLVVSSYYIIPTALVRKKSSYNRVRYSLFTLPLIENRFRSSCQFPEQLDFNYTVNSNFFQPSFPHYRIAGMDILRPRGSRAKGGTFSELTEIDHQS